MTALKWLPLRCFLVLVGIEVVLAILHAVFVWPPDDTWHPDLVLWVHMNREGNLPTWFSSMQLALLAMILVFIHRVELRRVPGRRLNVVWMVCAAIALFLSADEASSIHERAGTLLGTVVEKMPDSFLSWLAGIPSYYWPVVYLPVVIPATVVIAVLLWRDLGRARNYVIAGVALYLFGSVVLDHYQVFWASADGEPAIIELNETLYYFDIYLCEEWLEMFAVSLIVLAFLKHLVRRRAEVLKLTT